MSKVCVRLNLHALGLRLAAEQKRFIPLGEIHAWLNANGFELRGHWYCDATGLGNLRPGEVIEAISEEKIDGVTFVKRETLPEGAG
jgi:hypothetical protein